jgi:alpha-tubulin suppressor-like RCC1 family protein
MGWSDRRRHGALRRATIAGVISGAVVLACYGPTEVRLAFSTNLGCNVKTRITIGEEISDSEGCLGGEGRIGDLVVIPAGARDGRASIKAVLAIDGVSPENCDAPQNKARCVIAKRNFRFIEHTARTLPVVLRDDCLGVTCEDDPDGTCEHGQCVSADPDVTNFDDSRGGVDGGLVDAPPVMDAKMDSTADAPIDVMAPDASAPVCVSSAPTIGAATSIAGGLEAACALRADGSVWCWGYGVAPIEIHSPAPLTALAADVASIDVGTDFQCAVKTDASLWCWGSNPYTIVVGDVDFHAPRPFFTGVAQVSTGDNHACLVKTDGTLWCWGQNASGELGDGSTNDQPTPVQVTTLGNSAAIVAAGMGFTCAKLKDGSVSCWGTNAYGQLGTNDAMPARSTPQPVTTLGTTVASIATGNDHACAVRTNGTLWCWGNGVEGKLGNGMLSGTQATPIEVTAAGGNIRQASCAPSNTCVTKSDGTALCWGSNQFGQLGKAPSPPEPSPIAMTILGSSIVETETYGAGTIMARNADGSLFGIGSNSRGALGIGTLVDSPTPKSVTGVPCAAATYNDMTKSAFWTTFDVSTANAAFTQFQGAIFDGTSVILVPDKGGAGEKAARYTLGSPFSAAASWSLIDFGPTTARGFSGGVRATERSIIFPPSPAGMRHLAGTFDSTNGVVDTIDTSLASPTAMDFLGAVFDGRYTYLVPNGANTSGNIVRIDTQQSNPVSFDLTTVNAAAKGYAGGTFDGQYVYLAPNGGSVAVRLDTFDDTLGRTVAMINLATSVSPAAKGFRGAVFDGRYVYLVPDALGASGLVVRHDTHAAFTSSASWTTFDVATVDPLAHGFFGGAFDGRYIYLVPNHSGPAASGLIARYDTRATFTAAAAWSTFDIGTVNGAAKGFAGAAFDGRYLYLAPAAGSTVARFDAKTPTSIPATVSGGSFF